MSKSITTPNPGSKEAQDTGCSCPVLDNNNGEGMGGMFWISNDCPLHGVERKLSWNIITNPNSEKEEKV